MLGSERVLVAAPVGRDAAILGETLAAAGLAVEACSDATAVATAIAAGAGVVLMTEHALHPAAVADLAAVLGAQPPWSDIPFVLLVGAEPVAPHAARAMAIAQLRAVGNVTVVERPIRPPFLITIVEAALRARRRQYELRAVLDGERAARAAAEEAQATAESALRVRDEFLATVSHELRTPLGAILLWTRLLEDHRLTEAETQRAVEAIGQSARAQSQLIEDLLDVARMTSGKLRLEMSELALERLVEASLAVVAPAATIKRLRVEANVEPGIVLYADPDRMQQVLVNILSNAVKLTPPEGRIAVSARGAGGNLVIEIADTGAGIDEGVMPFIFDRFRQGAGSVDRHTSGLGLGLAISRSIMELHGGTVRAASAGPGRGATFTVEMPLPVPARVAHGAPAR